MQIDYKLQIDVIKGVRIFYCEYENLVFISDGKIGAYLSEKDLKIDKSKMTKIEKSDLCDPDILRSHRFHAKETNIVRRHCGKYYVKLKAHNIPNFCYVNDAFLKMFKYYDDLFIRGENDNVYIEKHGQPFGTIMPALISKEEK